MKKKGVLIAMAARSESLSRSLRQAYEAQGYEVCESNAAAQDEVKAFFESLEGKNLQLVHCVYLAPSLFSVSVFDPELIDHMQKSLEEGLMTGTWWVQQYCDYVKRQGIRGDIVVMNHAASIVPTQRYSYCCVAEAALANLVRVAAMDTHGAVPVRLNLVTCGWQQEEAAERAFEEELKALHKGAKAPILQCVTPQEIAETCVAAGTLEGMNGNNLVVDHGFVISRTIRQLDEQ